MRGVDVRAAISAAAVALMVAAWSAPSAAADKKAPLADAPIGTGLDDASAPKLPWPEPTPETVGLDHVAEMRLLQRPDGSVVLSAMRWGKVDGEHRIGYWLAYLDAEGRATRQVFVPISENEIPTDAIATSDSGFLLFSWIHDLRLIRLDSEGRRIWSRKLDDYEISEAFPPKVAQLPDGGFLVGGSAAGPSRVELRYRLTRVTADGHIVWQRSYGRIGQRSITALAPMADGTALVLGSNDLFAIDRQGRTRWSRPRNAILDMSAADGQSTILIERTVRNQEWVWEPKFHLARLDRNGRVVWRRFQDFSPSGPVETWTDRLIPAPGGGSLLYLKRQFDRQTPANMPGLHVQIVQTFVLSIAHYDADGGRKWVRTVVGPNDISRSSSGHEIEDVAILPSGKLLILGIGWPSTESHFDEWWLRTIPFD